MRRTRDVMTIALVIGLAAALGSADDLTPEVKWSQPPVLLETGTNFYNGWDEPSTVDTPIVADDFLCNDPRPVTDVHWWGSYPGYLADASTLPPTSPDGFLINFWTNVPVNDPTNTLGFSHPGDRIWSITAPDFLEVDVGIDIDPRNGNQDTMFQYNVTFESDQYFHQKEGTIYWISIQSFWGPNTDPTHRWGWKTRPHFWNDDAVVGNDFNGTGTIDWVPIEFPQDVSWDMAYELSVPEPATISLLALGSLALIRRRTRK